MKSRERAYLILSALLIGASAVGLGGISTAAVPLEQLGTSLQLVYGNIQYALLAALLLLVALVMLFFALRSNERVETLLQQGVLGEVRICFKAVENLVLKAARSVKGVREIRTRIVQTPGGLTIFLRAVTLPDLNIPQVTAELQGVVKDYVENSTGSEVAEIKVMIENVATEPAKAVR